jgi:hypothetical protein
VEFPAPFVTHTLLLDHRHMMALDDCYDDAGS